MLPLICRPANENVAPDQSREISARLPASDPPRSAQPVVRVTITGIRSVRLISDAGFHPGFLGQAAGRGGEGDA